MCHTCKTSIRMAGIEVKVHVEVGSLNAGPNLSKRASLTFHSRFLTDCHRPTPSLHGGEESLKWPNGNNPLEAVSSGKSKTCVDSRFHFLVIFGRHSLFTETSRRILTAMKRFLQLVGEMSHYRLKTAKLALQELIPDDELVIVVPEQSLVGEIQQWATSQGLTVAAPKKMLDGLARWQLSVKKVVPAPVVEEKPAAAAPPATAAPAPAAASTPPEAPAAADASAH
jgi:hypothetical protein